MTPRLFVRHTGDAWAPEHALDLPEGAARHAQVLRLQPGDALTLFDGRGGEWAAEVLSMGRKEVSARLLQHLDVDRELGVRVTVALGMPTNDRMDALVEKATELGVHAIQPLVCARSVLRLDGERAGKKVAHWQSVVESACEQSGRTRVPEVRPVLSFKQWVSTAAVAEPGAVLSFAPQHHVHDWLQDHLEGAAGSSSPVSFLSGPEGGLTDEEEAQAKAAGWVPVGLGPRVLRADTAPLMALSLVGGLMRHAQG
ncbi:MAG TPA: 16S rRNA (uracil(1498)-N(3))-methyltransferase [Aquabacterium sp.]|uniref:16S rRNA (uracil(1498)-N(3))-methyltransferase n=1 Tax=Aquabacterium sp. TaxID=1872578 RepID=UPI002E2EA799|nr:16S rRNA (uracil(1498)-N(3))-methyltransferase [Aquabacterium sp.]HEX5374007.1 16S rRNA (uracil(1498)-N(3))-methyltransferase [Aquabacterium sp.]